VNQFLVVIELKGKNTERLKGHIISKRITANSAEEAVSEATNGNRLFEEEGFEIISVQILYI
jgi:hypothetical protein